MAGEPTFHLRLNQVKTTTTVIISVVATVIQNQPQLGVIMSMLNKKLTYLKFAMILMKIPLNKKIIRDRLNNNNNNYNNNLSIKLKMKLKKRKFRVLAILT